MREIFKWQILVWALWSGCKVQDKKIVLPDLKPHFSALLNRRDSTLSLDSFYFIGLDTMTEKRAFAHQKFAFSHIIEKIDDQLKSLNAGTDSFHSAPSADVLEKLEYLRGEKRYVSKEIDSFNILIANADSTTPVGYRAFYKVTVRKKNAFTVSDTIPYSITLKMKVGDWDRNLEKGIDSLALGKPYRTGGIN